MLTVDHTSRRLIRLACPAQGAEHRCLLNHSPLNPHPVFTHHHSPIAWLSNEELLLIFEAALDSVFIGATAFEQLQRPDILVAISQVCRRWRAIALSNSGLWTNISSCSLSEIQRYLSRSGTRPLNIYEQFPTSSGKDESVAIADALVERAYRWKTLLWIDCSPNNTTNVARLLQTPNAYPALERLELSIPQCIPLKAAVNNASNTILFPALQHLSLTRVHPMVLPCSTMPSLLTLKLDGLGRNLFFSRLFYHLLSTPALRTLILHGTLLTLDPHRLANIGLSPPSVFPNGALSAPATHKVKLPTLDSLSLCPAPAWSLWLLFHYLELPALAKLDLHVHTGRLYWPWILPDGRPVDARVPPESRTDILGPDHWAISLPALRTLHITYCVSSPPAPAPAPFPQIRRLVFPGLTELQIIHALASDPHLAATAQAYPPPPPLPAFDALFHAPDFRHLVRLTLIGCILPLATLCDALRVRMPALEVLTLAACRGAAALVCALAPEECGGQHERCERRPGNTDVDTDKDSDSNGDAWIGTKVSVVIVARCPGVRAGCLRKVVEARVRANVGASALGSGREGSPLGSSTGPVVGSKSGARVRRPERIAQLRVIECPGVTKDDIATLAAIPGAPSLHWLPWAW
ncbi:hypothetical protein GSI_07892 [Ganoderma sinense ZZ0214-1]|uniref:F-box domain-containing protein n=1 Tax=Ganoderma sinense ZZ0214-1 TaxID=1077348 RepID=A0A2G8S896_9APHY|nr:hypothetical protein GSI_07892 [Ganoderma sinense ZZ0214-1]